jgi:threonine synthase
MLGLIQVVNTHMYVTQAAGSFPIVNAFQAGILRAHPVKPNTIARSIAVGDRADGYYALRVTRQLGGGAGACAVSDEEVVEGMKLLAETAGGVVIAGLRKLVSSGIIKKGELTVAFVTGAGFETQEVIAERVHPLVMQPDLESLEEVFGKCA